MKFLHLVSILLAITGSYAEGSLRNGKEQTQPKDEWWKDQPRSLQSLSCPAPDTFTSNLPFIRTGQYGSTSGDCFYIHWDPEKCSSTNKCPLYVYVDGTENAGDIDDRDSVFMEQMAARGYVAVTVDYADSSFGYTSGCGGFNDKSSKIFDESVAGTVLHQLCRDTANIFNHGPNVPVDCGMGVAVNGWSQGAHIAALGAANSPDGLVTGALLWGNGNYNWACSSGYPDCSGICIPTSVSCMNDANLSLSLPKEKRRSIVGDQDTFFGACDDSAGANNRANVVAQQQATSGYACPDGRDDCMRRLPEACKDLYGTGEQTCIDPSSENFGRQYALNCPSCNEASSCDGDGLASGACPAFIEPEDTAGYYVIPGKPHDFMDTNPGSDFMTSNVLWGLYDNFNWLAEVSRVSVDPLPTSTPTKFPTKSPVLPGICSDDNENDCSTTQDCECGQTPQRHLRELQTDTCGGLKKKDCDGTSGCQWSSGSCVSSALPTPPPTESPTTKPTSSPSMQPTKQPTASPVECICYLGGLPTSSPTPSPPPTLSPTSAPTKSPSTSPTANPVNQCLARGAACILGQEADCCAKTCATKGQKYKCE